MHGWKRKKCRIEAKWQDINNNKPKSSLNYEHIL